jgi:hypothetical protein
MADLIFLAIGCLIGFVIARRRYAREQAAAIVGNLSAQFADHCERHAKRLEGSTVLTAPGAIIRE